MDSNMEIPVLGTIVVAIGMAVEDFCRIQCSVRVLWPVCVQDLVIICEIQVRPVEGEGRWEQAELTWGVGFHGLWPPSSETSLAAAYPWPPAEALGLGIRQVSGSSAAVCVCWACLPSMRRTGSGRAGSHVRRRLQG